MSENNTFVVTNEDGQEKTMEIVLTFDNDDNTRHFVLFTDPEDEEGQVYAYAYDEENGEMDEVTDPDEIEMCAEVLAAFQETFEDGEEEA